MTNQNFSQARNWLPSRTVWILIIPTIIFLPVIPGLEFIHDFIIHLSANLNAGGAYDIANINYDIQRWVVAAILINMSSLGYAWAKMYEGKSKGDRWSKAEVNAIQCLVAVFVISIGYTMFFMFYPGFEFAFMVLLTFAIYFVSDVRGFYATKSDLVENVSYRYSLFSLELPALFVLFLIVLLHSLTDFPHNNLVFLTAGQMIVTSIAYALVNEYVVKHAQDNFRSLLEKIRTP